MRFAFALLLPAFLACGLHPAHAELSVQAGTAGMLRCGGGKIYTVRSTDAPAAIAAGFAGRGKIVGFSSCTDLENNIHYFIRKPRPNRGGVCRLFEDEIFPGTAKDFVEVDTRYNDARKTDWYFDMKGWKPWAPEAWTRRHYQATSTLLAFLSPDKCPPPDDARYIPVGNLTDGMLKAFFRVWKRATASPDAFDAFFAKVPYVDYYSLLGITDPSPAQDLPGRMKVRLRVSVFAEHAEVGEISCAEDGSGCHADVGRFAIDFDVGERGVTITKLESLLTA